MKVKKVLAKMEREARVNEVASDIMADAAKRAGKLSMLPQSTVAYNTPRRPHCKVGDKVRLLVGAYVIGEAIVKGRFILSLNDVPEVRSIFKNFNIEAVETTYSIAKAKTKKVGEVIISNIKAG